MNITGIITEYNPFHSGHLYHLNNAKKDTNCDAVICIMSGNFVQRGMPALVDKWTRAQMAIENGVDLVIELPLIYSIASAEGFSKGAIKILNDTGVVNNIYFGSEHGSIDNLNKIADVLVSEPKAYKVLLKDNLKTGLPFHTARSNSLSEYLTNIPCKDILSSSNNILAIEYLKSLKKCHSNIQPFTLKRTGSAYNDTQISSSFSSATSIREALKNGNSLNDIKNCIPINTFKILNKLKNNNYSFVYNEDIFPFLKYKLLTEGENIKKILDVKEGLDNKILKEVTSASSLDELIMKIKSKRYTYTRISRILTSFFIGLENYDLEFLLNNNYDYVRPLAFNCKGSKILKEIKKAGNIDIITKLPKKITNPKLELDILGTKAYSILNSSVSPFADYLTSPLYIK